MSGGLSATAALWPDIQTAYTWVHRAAHILANDDHLGVADIGQAYDDLLTTMTQQPEAAGSLASAVSHFVKVTDSYKPGLFHCYTVPDLPRTNNDLEHYFGSARYLERRTTGRKVAAPSLVIRGAVRIVAAVATHRKPFEVEELGPVDREKWTLLRRTLDYRHEARRAQLRFRRDPQAYLAAIEDQLLKPTLPP